MPELTPELSTQHNIPVLGMTCAACVRHVERAILAVPGVQQAAVDLITSSARVVANPGQIPAIRRAVEGAGYVVPELNDKVNNEAVVATDFQAEVSALVRSLVIALALTLPLLVLAMSHGTWRFTETVPGLFAQAALATAVLFGPGLRYYRAAWSALRHRLADMNTLIALGAGAAWLYSAVSLARWISGPRHAGHIPHLYFEASATIVTFVLIGKWLEARSRRSIRGAVSALAELLPDGVEKQDGDEWKWVRTPALKAGDVVRVPPGARIPADGTVTSGHSCVNEAVLTGESVPREVEAGAAVFAGTLNDGSASLSVLEIRVALTAGQSRMGHLERLVRNASANKAPIADLADRVSAVFVPIVLAISALAAAVWLALGASAGFALERAVSVLVIACPCALGLATPAALAVGIARGAKLGFVFAGGRALQSAATIDTLVFDKTGTLTKGAPELDSVESAPNIDPAHGLALAAALAAHSPHPITQALRAADHLLLPARDVQTTPGGGAVGSVQLPKDMALAFGYAAQPRWAEIAIGNEAFLRGRGVKLPLLLATQNSAVHIACENRFVASAYFVDPVLDSAREALQALKQDGMACIVASGDTEAAVLRAAQSLPLHASHARLSPADKLKLIRDLQGASARVAMVGDGVNDGPALAAANLGIAVVGATAVADQAADVTLARGDLRQIRSVFQLARASMRTIRGNLFWAFIYNVVGIAFASGALVFATGWALSPMLASAAMSLSSVSVLLHSLRLRYWRPSTHHAR